MKRYEFHSALPSEEVFARLSRRAKKGGRADWRLPGEFYCRRKGEQFRLDYEGFLLNRLFIPFSGTVRVEGTGSVITGGFPVFKESIIASVILLGVTLLVRLCTGEWLSPRPYGHHFGTYFLAAYCFAVGVLWLVNITFFHARRKRILKFMEDHLLK